LYGFSPANAGFPLRFNPAYRALSKENSVMLPFDVAIDAPVQMVEVSQVSNADRMKALRDATLCGIASGRQFSAFPLSDVLQTLPRKDRPKTRSWDIEKSVAEETTIVHSPKHGEIEEPHLAKGMAVFTYRPNDGFDGEDRFTLQTVYA
jgi:hypothetical protein